MVVEAARRKSIQREDATLDASLDSLDADLNMVMVPMATHIDVEVEQLVPPLDLAKSNGLREDHLILNLEVVKEATTYPAQLVNARLLHVHHLNLIDPLEL